MSDGSVEINDSFHVICSFKGRGKYNYCITNNGKEMYNKTVATSPDELGEGSIIGKAIMDCIRTEDTITVNGVEVKLTQKQVQESKLSEFNRIRTELHEKLMEHFQEEEQTVIEDKVFHNKYGRYYRMYQQRYRDYHCTELDFVTAVTHGLGVDIGYEIIKAYLTYLQTLLGLKATNLIAIGGQATGKTHILEQALSLLPQEYVHRGIMTEASFFTMYNGCDLSKHIFYLGDLGGAKDDDKTIIFRDLIKELSTDGIVSRNIKDVINNEVITEEVVGHPCLTYTTVLDSMVNEQEASRSALLTPPPINTKKLTIYLQLKEQNGNYESLFSQIEEDKKAIQGLTYYLMCNIKNYTLINPYMFICEQYLKNITNYNRKITEFNELLKIVCILSGATTVERTNNSFEVEKIVIADKRMVLTTLYLFDTSELLPTEIKLFKGLSRKYEPYPLEKFSEDGFFTEIFDDEFDYEKEVFADIYRKSTFNAQDMSSVIEDIQSKTCNGSVKYRNEEFDGIDPRYLFTITTLRKHYNQRWYKENKNVLPEKLHKFFELGLLIRVGKTDDGRVIYGIHKDADVEYIKPSWDKKLITEALEIFRDSYSDCYDDIVNVVEGDSGYKSKTIPVDYNNPMVCEVYDLLWESDVPTGV